MSDGFYEDAALVGVAVMLVLTYFAQIYYAITTWTWV